VQVATGIGTLVLLAVVFAIAMAQVPAVGTA
jgi:hypothetical protein